MNFGVLSNILPFTSSSQNAKTTATTLVSKNTLTEKPEERSYFNINIWGWSIMSIVSWAIHQDVKRTTQPTPPHGVVGSNVTHPTVKQTTQPTSPHGGVGSCVTHPTIRFRPYVCKVPWHTGARAFLSQLFPRYGHYCGPNWSSGKDGGSLLWDKRPIDWLDFCCYCHDIGYDSHDQAELLRADMAFLQCLERPHMTTKGDPRVAHLYKTMCISGLRNILIPYRNHLVKLQSGQLSIGFGWVGNIKWKGWNPKNP